VTRNRKVATLLTKTSRTSYEIVPSVTGTCLLEHGDGDDSEYVDDGGDSSAPTPEGKRDEESLEKRQNLAGIAAGSITAGCRCLSLRPRTVTATITPEPKVRLPNGTSLQVESRRLTVHVWL